MPAPSADEGGASGGQNQTKSQSHEPQKMPPRKPSGKKGGTSGMKPGPSGQKQKAGLLETEQRYRAKGGKSSLLDKIQSR